MGSVYLAERDTGDFGQRVALKLVRADLVGSEARARFLRERNFLARLVHPHIAQLHDGGVAGDGAPYFTLEYVEGESITRWCDGRKADVRKRVALMLQVCSAIAYAHRNLIVHRDLKPSNIFVTASGEVKLLDFGIAKLVDPDVADRQTATQARLMTPEYAAPEQVLGEPITTATDVYAIGVLLYELLSGRLPYARADAGAISFPKAVVEEAPESLQRALNRTSAGSTTGEAAAASRGTTVSALRRSLRGDLERIVQRALAKSPEARYASVAMLADDLRAFIDGRAISGGSRRYRVRMFLRRYWLPLAAAAAILLIGLASGAAIVWQSRQIAREAQNTLQVRDFLFGLFTAVDPHEAKGREVSARELLDRGAVRVEQNAALDAEQRAEIEATLGRTYYQLGLFDQANKLQEQAIAALATDRTRATLLARTESERAETLAELGDLKAAAEAARDARTGLAAIAGAAPVDRARVIHAQATVALAQRDFAAAKRFASEELEALGSGNDEEGARYRALMTAGGASWGLESWPDAEARFREALAVASAETHPDELNVARAETNVAMSLQSQSRYAEAGALEQKALAIEDKMFGPDHATTMATRRDLGLSEMHLGHYAQARELLEQVVAAQRRKLGGDHPAIAGSEINLGILLVDLGDLDAADKVLNESFAIFEKKYGRDFQGAHIALGNLAALHLAQGKLDLAESELKEVATREIKQGQKDKDSVLTLIRQGELQRLRGNLEAAIALHRRATAGAHEKYGEANRYSANAHRYLGTSLRDAGDDEAAIGEFRFALASYAGYLSNAEHPLAATTRYELGLLLLKHGETRAEGVRMLAEAVELREKFLGADHPLTRQARDALRSAQLPART